MTDTELSTKPTIAQRLLKIASILCLVAGVLGLLMFGVLGALGLTLNTEDLAAALEVSADSARIHLILTLILGVIACIAAIVQGIFGLRVRKHHKSIRAFLLISGITLALAGVEFIWNIAMGEYADTSSALSALLGVIYDVAVLVVAFKVAREVDNSPEEKAAEKAAKEAKKAQKLGALGGLMFAYGANIVFSFVVLIIVTRDEMTYDYNTITNWITIVLQAVCFYLIWKRLRIARPVVIFNTSIAIAIKTISLGLTGNLTIWSFLLSNIFDFGMLIYMIVAERPKRLLVNEMSFELRTDVNGSADYIATTGWPRTRNLILYYCVFSVLGHWMELAFCLLIRAGVVAGDYDPTNTMLWRDLLFPFPMEGLAVVICAVWLYPFKNWLIEKINKPLIPLLVSFVTNALLCSALEFVGGLLANPNHELWDYSNMPFNIMGQVCLQNAIGFGIACTLIAWIVYPAMERAIARIPGDVMNVVFVAVVSFNLILQVLYLVEPLEIAKAFTILGSNLASLGGGA